MFSEGKILEGDRVTTRKERTIEACMCGLVGGLFFILLFLEWWFLG